MDIQIKADEKARKGDHKGVTIDFTKAINIDPNNAKAYYNRCVSKYNSNNPFGAGACEDASKAESLGYDASKLIQATCN